MSNKCAKLRLCLNFVQKYAYFENEIGRYCTLMKTMKRFSLTRRINEPYDPPFVLSMWIKQYLNRRRHFRLTLDAVSTGNRLTIQILIGNGIDINIQNKRKETVLHYVISKSDVEPDDVRWLLTCGADSNAPDTCGLTPFMYAAVSHKLEMIQLLVQDDNVTVDAQDKCGRTALSYAAEAQNIPVVEWLLQNTADPCLRDTQGDTPWDYVYFHRRSLLTTYIDNRCRDDFKGRDPDISLLRRALGNNLNLIIIMISFFKNSSKIQINQIVAYGFMAELMDRHRHGASIQKKQPEAYTEEDLGLTSIKQAIEAYEHDLLPRSMNHIMRQGNYYTMWQRDRKLYEREEFINQILMRHS